MSAMTTSTTMSVAPARSRAGTGLRPGPVTWTTVVVLAVLMAYADGFVLTSIQGAVGAIERTQSPFSSWLRTSTLMTPVFVLAVLAALAFARRRLGRSLRTPRTIVATALLIVLAGGLVGTGEVVASAAYDYHLQSERLRTMQSTHAHPVGPVPDPAAPVAAAEAVAPEACTGTCAAQERQLAVDQRAARYGSALVLGANLALVFWVLAVRGGRLDSGRRQPPPISSPSH
jgi:hypothetical protein